MSTPERESEPAPEKAPARQRRKVIFIAAGVVVLLGVLLLVLSVKPDRQDWSGVQSSVPVEDLGEVYSIVRRDYRRQVLGAVRSLEFSRAWELMRGSKNFDIFEVKDLDPFRFLGQPDGLKTVSAGVEKRNEQLGRETLMYYRNYLMVKTNGVWQVLNSVDIFDTPVLRPKPSEKFEINLLAVPPSGPGANE